MPNKPSRKNHPDLIPGILLADGRSAHLGDAVALSNKEQIPEHLWDIHYPDVGFIRDYISSDEKLVVWFPKPVNGACNFEDPAGAQDLTLLDHDELSCEHEFDGEYLITMFRLTPTMEEKIRAELHRHDIDYGLFLLDRATEDNDSESPE